MAQQNIKTERQHEKSQSLARAGAMAPARLFGTPADMLRLSPFTLMGRMMEEMDRMVATRVGGENGGTAFFVPPIEVSNQNGDYKIRAELAGLKPEEVKVEINGDAVVLEGDRKFEREDTKGGVYRTELQYGHFYRSIPLPEGADVEHARARFENGVLEVTVPVAQTPGNNRQIPVEASSAQTQAPAAQK